MSSFLLVAVKKTQNRAEKSECIFHTGGRIGYFGSGHAGLKNFAIF